jgi:hypothetical protein
MSDPSAALTGQELFWLISLIAIFGFDLLQFALRRDPLSIYQPPVFVIAFMSYYCILGPIQRAINNDWNHVLHDFRGVIGFGWIGAIVFYLSLRIGYAVAPKSLSASRLAGPFEAVQASSFGRKLCWIGIALFALVNGLRVIAYLNPFGVQESQFFYTKGFDVGPLKNYANTAINLLIPGILLQFAAWLKTRTRMSPWLIWTYVAFAIFTSLGFRWRIVTLFVPMIIIYFLSRNRRPSFFLLAISAIALLAYSGFVELTRGYGTGLDVDQEAALSLGGTIDVGLNESSVFLVTGGLIASAPLFQPFVGLQPLISTVLLPIPSAIWEDKNSFEYLSNALMLLFGSPVYSTGQAVLNYGEYYLMFGWPSLILVGLLSGWLLRFLWNWFYLRRGEVVAQVAYAATSGLLYIWISRGYLPQFAFTFAFGAMPLFWFYYRSSIPAVE